MTWESCDTNILFYSLNPTCPEHSIAGEYLDRMDGRSDFLLCELVLTELYVLIRNPTINAKALSAAQASEVIRKFRQHPKWRLVDYPGYLMADVWRRAGEPNFSRRQSTTPASH